HAVPGGDPLRRLPDNCADEVRTVELPQRAPLVRPPTPAVERQIDVNPRAVAAGLCRPGLAPAHKSKATSESRGDVSHVKGAARTGCPRRLATVNRRKINE